MLHGRPRTSAAYGAVMDPTSTDADTLSTVFADIARELQAQTTRQETWQRIAELAVDTLPNATHSAISIVHRSGEIKTEAANDEVGPAVDLIQYETQQGPCLSAIREESEYHTRDLATEARWPEFSSRAATETGVHSMLAFRLFADETTMGALNLYSDKVDAFTETCVSIGRALAAHAAVAMMAAQQEEKVDQLETALTTNRRISVAIGMIMEASKIDEEHAFDVLRAASQRLNLPIGIVAERVVRRTS